MAESIKQNIQNMSDTEAILYLENYISSYPQGSSFCIPEILILAELYAENKDHESALTVLFNALHYENQISQKKELAEIYYQIALIYSAWSKYEIALTYVTKSIMIYNQDPTDPDFLFQLLYSKTNILTWLDKYDDAYIQIQSMLSERSLLTHQRNLLFGLLGVILKGQMKYDEALEYLIKCVNYLKQSSDTRTLHSIYKSIGDCLIKMNRLEEAETYLLQSYEYFLVEKYNAKNPQILLIIFDFLINLYALKNDLQEEKKYLYLKNDFQTQLLKTDSAAINQFHWKLAIQNARTENEILKEKNILKEQFLNLVSHDMKSPLGGILGMIEILQNSPLNKDQKDCLQYMQRSSEDLLKFVNDLLDISKINAGKLEILHKPMILRDLISDLSITIQSLLTKTNNTWEVHYEVSPDTCYITDRFRLYQILLNLCSNANKFTKNGAIKLHIQENQTDTQSHTLQFQITDTGTGISTENLEKIFETFTQLHNDINHLEKGSGLGLSIVSKLLTLLQGEITVSSQLGQGSQFQFYIPVQKIDTQIHTPNQNTNPRTEIKNKKILLIEDNQTIQYFIKKIVTQLQMQIHTIDSLSAFQELMLQPFDFDYVLLDDQLTDCESRDILLYIAEQHPSLMQRSTFISISSDTDPTLRDTLHQYQVHRHITKPFHSEQLLQALLS